MPLEVRLKRKNSATAAADESDKDEKFKFPNLPFKLTTHFRHTHFKSHLQRHAIEAVLAGK